MTTFLKVKNRAVSTLASGISDTVTSLTVATGEGAKFPSTYPFHITIDDEILSCTNRSTDVLTVVRAQEGTSAASHSAGATVSLNITAEIIQQLQDHEGLTTGVHGAGSKYLALFGQESEEVSKVVWRPSAANVLNLTNQTSSTSWTDLDLTSDTSANAKFVIMQMLIHLDSYTDGYVALAIRKNGTTGPTLQCMAQNDPAGLNRGVMLGFCAMDAGQVIEYEATISGTAQADFELNVAGYIE